MKKKVLIALLALTVAVSAMGCGSKKSDSEIQQKPKQKAAAKRKKQQKKWRQTATDMLWLLIPMISQNMSHLETIKI